MANGGLADGWLSDYRFNHHPPVGCFFAGGVWLGILAQYLTQQEIDDIIYSPMERGILDENGDPLYGNTGW